MSRLTIACLLIVCYSCNEPAAPTVAATGDTAAVQPAAPTYTLSETEKAEGWQMLFDGTSKDQWHVFNNKTDGHAWVIDEGALSLDPKEFKDWQTVGGDRKSTRLNSSHT